MGDHRLEEMVELRQRGWRTPARAVRNLRGLHGNLPLHPQMQSIAVVGQRGRLGVWCAGVQWGPRRQRTLYQSASGD